MELLRHGGPFSGQGPGLPLPGGTRWIHTKKKKKETPTQARTLIHERTHGRQPLVVAVRSSGGAFTAGWPFISSQGSFFCFCPKAVLREIFLMMIATANGGEGASGGVGKILHLPVIRLRATLFFNPQGQRCPLKPQDSFDTARRLFSAPPNTHTHTHSPTAPQTHPSALRVFAVFLPQTFSARLCNGHSIVLRRKRRSKVSPGVTLKERCRRSRAFHAAAAAAAACDLCHNREHLPTPLEQFKLSLGWCVLLIYFNHMHFSSWI